MVTLKQLTAAQNRVTKTARKFGSVSTQYLQLKKTSKKMPKSLFNKYRNASATYQDASRKYRKLLEQYENKEKSKMKKYTDFRNRMGVR